MPALPAVPRELVEEMIVSTVICRSTRLSASRLPREVGVACVLHRRKVDEVSMRRTFLFSCAIVSMAACGGKMSTAPTTTTITSAPILTSGPVAEHELPRTLSSTSAAIALAVCKHESRCGRGKLSTCIDATTPKARAELSRWSCEPAATRARYEECLVGFNDISCDVNLNTDKRPYCPRNAACGYDKPLIDPGPPLEKIWE